MPGFSQVTVAIKLMRLILKCEGEFEPEIDFDFE